MYKKIYGTENGIQRIFDKAFIPADETNSGYQEYLSWVAAGNIIEDYDGVGVYYQSQSIEILFLPTNSGFKFKHINGRSFYAQTIPDAVALKLSAIREDRNALLEHSDLITKFSYPKASDGLSIGIKNNAWVEKLRDVPFVSEQALGVIISNGGTIVDVFMYEPDFAPQPLPPTDIILTLRQFILALTLADPAFITNEEALAFSSDKTIPASIQAVFDNLPAESRLPAVLTFKTMQSVSRNDPLVAATGQSWGLTVEQLDQFFLTAFDL